MKLLLTVFLGCFVFVSCKKETAAINHPPVANAGNDTTIEWPGSLAYLDGSASGDPENNITGYQWTKISGPSAFQIGYANDIHAKAENLVEGTYQFELKVTDRFGLFSRDTVKVAVVLKAITFTNLAWINDFNNRMYYLQSPQLPAAFQSRRNARAPHHRSPRSGRWPRRSPSRRCCAGSRPWGRRRSH